MAGSKDSSEISASNIIEPTCETLPADEQLQFEEHKERMIQEAKAKFLANFKVDRNNKVVWHRATDLALLRPTPDIPNVSNTNELQSLRNYVDEQREQMQNIIGGIQNDYRRLVRAFDKSNIVNFPSHEVELGYNTHNTSAIGCRDQSQPLYGMPMDTYPEQPQIGSKSADLHMPGPSACERGPSGPATVGPIFNELPTHVPEPYRLAQNSNYPVEPFAYHDGRSTYNHGRFGPTSGQSAHDLFEEDCYPNPHPSQQHFPSHYAIHQPNNTKFRAQESFPAPPRRPKRNDQSYEPYRASGSAPHSSNQWGGRQHANIQPTPSMFDQRADGLAPAAIDIVREEIAGAFRDKLGVSIVPGGQPYQKPYGSRFDHHPYPQGTRIPKFSKFSGDQGKNTREHIGQFLAQLGELADTEAFRVRLFSLSLTGTVFAWYATLPPNSISSWGDLEQKFHDHFFSGDYKLDLIDLVSLRQAKDESVNDYIRRFRDTRNRCFQIYLAEKQLAGLAFNGL
jgi:hypothetical protein